MSQFISEQIRPVEGTIDTKSMVIGEPGLPQRFIWRDREYMVHEVLEKWKETGPCKSGGGEQYVRKHWFRIRTVDGLEMKLYFERQPRSKSQRFARWWIFTIEDG